MPLITDMQRRVLVEHALDFNHSHGSRRQTEEERSSDVVADLAMNRPIGDRDLLVRFLWQRVSLVVQSRPFP
jgi:hypothetical protein